jgi:hypothetical protein
VARKDSQRIASNGGVEKTTTRMKNARQGSRTIVPSCVRIIQWISILAIVFARSSSLLLWMCLLNLAHRRLLGSTIHRRDFRLQCLTILELRAEVEWRDGEWVESRKGGWLVMRRLQMTALNRVRLLVVEAVR